MELEPDEIASAVLEVAAPAPVTDTAESVNESYKSQIYQAIQNASAEAHSPDSALLNPKSLQATIKKEMSLFEAGGTRRLVLEGAYKALLAIPPTSVESERAFSAAGYLCSKIRSRINGRQNP